MKRHHIVTVIILSLLVPQLATALPRPENSVQSKPEQQVCFPNGQCEISVPSNTPAGTATPKLLKDRSYRIEVSGIWYPAGLANSNHKADARCETSDSVNWGPSNKGVQIQNTFYGAVTSNDCDTDHGYSFQIIGSGSDQGESIRIIDTNYGDNEGILSAVVWAQNEVTWNVLVSQPVGTSIPATPEIGRFDFSETEVGGQRVSQTVTVNEETPAIGTPGIPLPVPELARIEIRFEENKCSGTAKRFSIAVTITGTPLPPTPPQCIANNDLWQTTSTGVGGEVPEMELRPSGTVGVGPGISSCQIINLVFAFVPMDEKNPEQCTWVVKQAQPEQSLGQAFPQLCNGTIGQLVCNTLKPGSSVGVKLSWSADTSKLYKTPVNDQNPSTGAETTALWAPAHTTDRDWYVEQTLAGNLNAEFKLFIFGPGGDTVFESSTVAIPGLGQIIEAAFTTKVAGF